MVTTHQLYISLQISKYRVLHKSFVTEQLEKCIIGY
jgi:hypothetical protein